MPERKKAGLERLADVAAELEAVAKTPYGLSSERAAHLAALIRAAVFEVKGVAAS